MSPPVRAETFWQRAVLGAVIFNVAALPLGLVTYALVGAPSEEGFSDVRSLIVFLPVPVLMCAPGILLYTAALDAVSARISPRLLICLLLTPLVILPWLALSGIELMEWPVFDIGIGTGLLVFGILVFLAQKHGWLSSFRGQTDGAPPA